jgi:hypothetical protein
MWGLNAVRSYFDLLATHWTRSDMQSQFVSADLDARRITFTGSVTWTWKKSGRSWREDFSCTVAFDEALKITHFGVRTESDTKTCIMRAVDESIAMEAPIIQVAVSLISPF